MLAETYGRLSIEFRFWLFFLLKNWLKRCIDDASTDLHFDIEFKLHLSLKWQEKKMFNHCSRVGICL